mmetsp:Transcript_7940/g.26945  ORF Transcript_7940/g.26945 Transcript_7940/m.26945 type:complete len:249 (+) Transcript_7940:517-1263(+)
MTAILSPGYLTIMVAVSYASGPSSCLMAGSIWQEPVARISMGSSPMRKRVMSRSCTAMSLKMPPPPLTYSKGGGAGSREHSLIVIVLPTSPLSMAVFTRAKLGSKRRWRAVMSLTPAALQASMASMVSGRSVAIGFSQNTCLPAAAHALIWSAWYWDGEQIHTASTSGWLITSLASPVKCGTLKFLAAASALDTVGLLIMTGRASGHPLRASRCTRPMRPAPMTPTPISFIDTALVPRAWRGRRAPGA